MKGTTHWKFLQWFSAAPQKAELGEHSRENNTGADLADLVLEEELLFKEIKFSDLSVHDKEEKVTNKELGK